jgi:hypothetical protein
MDQLKKNAFWIGVGVAGVALVAVFAVVVLPARAAVDKKGRDLSGVVTRLQGLENPAQSALKDYEALKEKMIAQYGKITSFYAASDKHFERWFPGLGENPNRGAFLAKYDGEIQALEKALAEKGTTVGVPDAGDAEKMILGFSWEIPDPGQWGQIGPADEPRVLKEIQKRFWARQRVANIVLRGGVKVNRIAQFRFFERLTNKVQTPPWEASGTGTEAIVWPGLPAAVAGFNRNFQEFELPNKLGRTVTFGFALDLPYSEVPKVLKEILNPDIEPRGESGADRLLVNLLGAEVTTQEQNEPSIDVPWMKGIPQAREKALEKAKEGIKARPVRMTVTCQIIDFEPAAIEKLTAEPPAAPENPEKKQ